MGRGNDRRNRGSSWWGVAVLMVALGGLLVAGLLPAVADDPAPVGDPAQLGITKTGPDAPVNVDTPFTFTINYSCSSLTVPCINASIADPIPPQLQFVSNTATSHPSNITYDAGTATLNVQFTQNVGGGQIGLNPGTTGNLDVVVKFPPGTTNGTVATNCATMAATNATSVQGCDNATALSPETFNLDLAKSFTTPQTGIDATHGIAGTGATTTVQLNSKITGNVGATSVLVTDPDGSSPFDKFDFVSFQPLVLPANVQATVEVNNGSTWVPLQTNPYGNGQTPTLSGADPPAGSIVGVRATYASTLVGGTVPVNQNLTLKFTIKLRDTLRSSPGTPVSAGAVTNCSGVVGSWTGHPDVTKSSCADYTVIARTPSADGSKSFNPTALVQGSGGTTALTLTGKNASNVAANQVVITDPTNGANPFNAFNFVSFNAAALSGGATGLLVEVSTTGPGGPWTALNSGTPYTNGQTPALPGSITASDVVAVRLTYTGSIAAGTSLSQVLNLKLRDKLRDAPGVDVPAQVYPAMNCESVDVLTNDGNAAKTNICAPFTVTAANKLLDGTKTFNPTSGVAQSGPTTTMAISGKNSNSSNAAITDLVVTDPGVTSGPTFDYFNFVSFGAITVPAGTTWKVEVFDGSTYVASPGGPYSNGQTPTLPGSVTAGQVQGIRYTLLTGSLTPNQGISTSVVLQLRNQRRSNSATIGSGVSITNVLDVESAGLTKVTKSATYTTTGVNPGTPTITKTFGTNPVIAGTGATTLITLTGANKANVVVDTLTLEDQVATASSPFWNSFDFTTFSAIAGMPAGVTVKVSVFDTVANAWVQNATAYNNGDTPALPGGVSAGNVAGVRFTFSGTIAVNQSLSGKFTTKLRTTTRDNGLPITGGNTVADCASNTYSGPLVPSTTITTSPCPTITISAVTYKVWRDKSWSPSAAVVNTDAQSVITLETRNTSNVGIDQIVVVDPGAGSTAPFEKFDFVSFSAVTLPTNVRVKVEVSTTGPGGPWTALNGGTTYSNGQVPSLAGSGVTAGQVQAIQLTLTATAGNTIPVSTGSSPATNRMLVPFTVQLRDTLRTGGAPVPPGQVVNCIDVTGSPSGAIEGGQPCAIYTILAESPGVSDGKAWSPSTGNRDELPSSAFTLTGRNSGNVSANSLTIQDPATVAANPLTANAFDAVQLTGFSGLTFPTGADRVQLDVLTADGIWHNGPAAATLPTVGSLPDGVAAVDVVGVRFTFTKNGGGLLPPETDSTKNAAVQVSVKLRQNLLTTHQQVPLGAINNCMNASVITPFGNATAQDKCATYTVTAGALTLVPDKTLDPPTPTSFNPGDVVIFKLQLKNTGTRNWNAPTVVDQFPATLVYDSTTPFPNGRFEYTANGSSLTTAPPDPTVAGNQVTFQWPIGQYLAPGQTAYLSLALQVAPGTPAGTQITNTYGVSETGGDFTCSPANTGSTIFVPSQKFCIDTQTITVKQSRGLSSLKEVRGDPGTTPSNIVVPGDPCPDDAGYTRYPCVAHTTVNSTFPYRLTVSNSGNVPMTRAIVIDKLPRVGDTGVIVNQPRDSAWTPTMATTLALSGVPAGATSTIYYSTVTNPCTAPLTGGAWCADWTTVFPGAATTAVGVDIVYLQADPMDPGESFRLDWSMTAPAGSPTDGSIAWNSFAYTGKPSDQPNLLLPAEPRKVGIVLDNPSLTVHKKTDPAGAAGTFDFTLAAVPPAVAPEAPATRSVTTPGQTATTPWANLTPGGTYILTETPQSGWSPGAFTCVDASNHDAPVAISADGHIVLPAGSDVVCTITNTKRPNIGVKKLATGGDGEFGFTLTGPDGFTAQQKQVQTTNGVGDADFDPPFTANASYTMSESSAPAGWISAFQDCTGATNVTPVTVDGKPGVTFTAPAAGEVECTFTNTLRPTVKIAKTSTGGNGTFPFTLAGVAGATGGSTEDVSTTPSGSGSFTWDTGLTPGGTYQLTETPKADWVSTFVSCTSAEQIAAIANGVQFVAPAGAEVSCSFTNTKRPTVQVAKTTTGGSGVFSFDLAGPSGGSTKPLDSQVGTVSWDDGLTPGGVYTLTEADAGPDWVSTFNGCDNATGVTPVPGGVQFTAPAGANVVCRFTNDKRPTVKIKKTSSGGDGQFVFDLSGPSGGSTQPVTTVNGAGSASWTTGLTPGGTYTLTETPQAGWVSTFVDCDNAQSVVPVVNGVQFVAPAGADVSCSFENSKPPTITVEKTSTGGDGQFSFTLDGPGGSTLPVSTVAGTGSASWGPDGLQPGADYTLAETVTDPWVSDFVSCTNQATDPPSSIGTPLDQGVGVVLNDVPAGADIDCAFTNAKRPTVKVLKQVAGGAGAFEFTLDGPGVPPSQNPQIWDTSGNPKVEWGDGLVPGSDYTLSEKVQTGWHSEFNDCTSQVGDGAPVAIGSALDDGVGVKLDNLPAGANVVCNFTNTKDPTIIVEKLLDGLPANDWQYNLSLPADKDIFFLPENTRDVVGTTSGDGTTSHTISPLPAEGGVVVTIDEVLKADTTFTGVTCVSTLEGVTTDRTPSSVVTTTETAKVLVQPGEVVRCSFANTTTEVGGITVTRESGGVLPFTGSPGSVLFKSSLWLLGLGVALIIVGRLGRRRQARA